MKYTVKAYLCTNFTGLMDSLETDSLDEAQDFIWANCQKGYNCELIDNKTDSKEWAYADDFNEATLAIEDLVRDLRMEQQEQM